MRLNSTSGLVREHYVKVVLTALIGKGYHG